MHRKSDSGKKTSDFEESTNFVAALMADITATWSHNAIASLPLTDYREATSAESALFSFKRFTDMHIDDESMLEKSKIQNSYFSSALRLKQLYAKVSNQPGSKFTPEIIALIKEIPLFQFPIDRLQETYAQFEQQKASTLQKKDDFEDEIKFLRTRLSLSDMEFIRTDDQLAILEAEVDNLELEIQRASHGLNKIS